MRLSHILKREEILSPEKPMNMEIGKPVSDSRKIQKNDVFFCEDGFHESGFSYLPRALEKGASCIVTTRDGAKRIGTCPIPVLEVENTRKHYALAWSRYENQPENDLRLIAVTGTNGKTSVSYFLHQLLNRAGVSTGLIGTIACSDGKNETPSDYTTPPPEVLYPLLSHMKKEGNTFVALEASSHAIAQNRLYGLSWETAIFTGLSRDHLDYHKTWEAYRDTKAALFQKAKHSLLCLDDASAKYMAFSAAGDVYYYGENEQADFRITDVVCNANGSHYRLHLNGISLPVFLPLVGHFHIANSAAAIACAHLAGIPAEILTKAAALLRTPPGRLEKLSLDTDFSVYIDYAHSPDALEKALRSLRPFTKKLTVLFGAGGERDRGKRPEMGRIAEELADFVIVTSDNPRGESPTAIIEDIMRGMKGNRNLCIENREEAIRNALNQAQAGEIILLAGKGHENYIIDENGKYAFSEREIVHRILNSRKGKDNVS